MPLADGVSDRLGTVGIIVAILGGIVICWLVFGLVSEVFSTHSKKITRLTGYAALITGFGAVVSWIIFGDTAPTWASLWAFFLFGITCMLAFFA